MQTGSATLTLFAFFDSMSFLDSMLQSRHLSSASVRQVSEPIPFVFPSLSRVSSVSPRTEKRTSERMITELSKPRESLIHITIRPARRPNHSRTFRARLGNPFPWGHKASQFRVLYACA